MGSERGFTLLELIVVTLVIAGLLTGTLFLFRPPDLGAKARNAQRTLDTAEMVQAVTRYVAAEGRLPEGLETTPRTIGNQDETEFDLCPFLVPGQLDDVPLDPGTGWLFAEKNCMSEGAVYSTGYTIVRGADGGVIIAAPAAEDGARISVLRKYPK